MSTHIKTKKFLLQIGFYTFLFFITLTALLLYHHTVLAQVTPDLPQGQSYSDLDNKRKDIQNQIKDLESQLSQSKTQETTLRSQLQYIDNQNKLTQLKIEDTQYQITKLDKEISELGSYIDNLSTRVDSLTKVLLERIITTYKFNNYSPLDLIFSAHGFADLLERIKYIQVIQSNDKKVLYNLQATKSTYNDQQTDRKTRQAEQQKLQKELVQYQNDLSTQKAGKAELLRLTQNDESKYQNLIKQMTAELASINTAISNIGAKIGPVNKGDVIAAMGSTGCSTGPHLHFETFQNAKVVGGKIVGTRVNPHNFLDNGTLGPPIRGYPTDTVITTEYGEVYKIFGFPSAHTGLDIAPRRYEGVGRPILAADKGIAYTTSSPCNYNIQGGSKVGKGVIVDHQNGIVTLYFHVL